SLERGTGAPFSATPGSDGSAAADPAAAGDASARWQAGTARSRETGRRMAAAEAPKLVRRTHGCNAPHAPPPSRHAGRGRGRSLSGRPLAARRRDRLRLLAAQVGLGLLVLL